METGDASEGGPRPAWDRVESGARCAFCLQALEEPVRTSCFRCHALYHADCWDANGARCAVYGCDPAAWVPARPTRTRPRRRPRRPIVQAPVTNVGSLLRGMGRGLLRLFFFGLIWLSIRAAFGVFSHDHGRAPASKATERVDLRTSGEFSELTRESRGFLYEIDRAGGLPSDPATRVKLRRTAEDLARRLDWGIQIYERNEVEGTQAIERRREWTNSLGRVLKILRELSTSP